MPYELYTIPKCGDCESVKKLLSEKKIDYSAYNLRDPEHKKVYGKIYMQIDGKLEREKVERSALLPLLVEVDNTRTVKRFAQKLEGISKLFN